jgi:hypothetical protein
MNVFQAAVFSALTIAGNITTTTERIIGNGFGTVYNMKRLFGPSSAKSLAKMSQAEKDKQLCYYAEKEVPKASRYAVFYPTNRYFNEILHLIEHGASVNYDVHYDWGFGSSGTFKPIYLFIKANDIAGARKLLERGATVGEVVQSKRWSGAALMFAQTVEMAQLLIYYGALLTCDLEAFYRNLPQYVAKPEYAAGLIPLYISCYESDKVAFAQEIWERLCVERLYYKCHPELVKQFHQKKQYLKDAGLEIDAQWDDDAFVWPAARRKI